MGKLIKAEVYRISNSGSNFACFAFILFLMCFFPFSGQWENFGVSLAENLVFFLQHFYVTLLIISIFMAVLLANQYQNRCYYYEIMSGENPHFIISSKLIVYIGYAFCFFIVPNVCIYIILALRNGLGGYDNIAVTGVLLGITVFRVVVRAVLLTMIVRRLVPVLGILYASFMLEQIMIYTIQKLFEPSQEVLEIIFHYFISQQITCFYQPVEYTWKFLVTVFVSFLLEAVALYGLTWYSYKKKKFR